MNLEFEKPYHELETKLQEATLASKNPEKHGVLQEEIARIQAKMDRILRQLYAKLTPAQKVQIARHPDRPKTSDYIQHLFQDYQPLAGDRLFGEDLAIIGGLARFEGQTCVVIGHERGKDTQSRLTHNFGMAKPEGYRKAQRLMQLAERFGLPFISLIDTAGAYPGIEAEERGQAEAIAKSIDVMLALKTPTLAIVIGEGGSGGAVAIAAADSVQMLENSIYSVISPEGCASILWRSGAFAQDAATALRLTAQDLKTLGVIDAIIPEPMGGAHRASVQTMDNVSDSIAEFLKNYMDKDLHYLLQTRTKKFLKIGQSL